MKDTSSFSKNKQVIENPSDVMHHALNRGVDLQNLPSYISIIMDGNGRWAQQKNLPRLAGHYEGYKSLRNIVIDAGRLGINFLTVYAFSTENWRRPEAEVQGLMQLYEQAAEKELQQLQDNNVRMRLTGRVSELPDSVQKALLHNVQETKSNTGLTFTLALNYGGRAEIVDAVKKIVQEDFPIEKITEDTLQQHLYQPDLPELDLMIRTSGEMRWSNFLMWQSAYAELYVSPVHWPAFDLDAFLDAILEYQKRKRRFGGI